MKTTRTYRRNTSNNNNDEGDKFEKSRQKLHRRCKNSHPYYGLDTVYEDEEYNPSSKKKRWFGSSSSTKQAQLRDPRRASSSSSLVTQKQRNKEVMSNNSVITFLSWLIDMEIVRENSFVCCYYWVNKVMVTGYGKITRVGIDCCCCIGLFSVPGFTHHIGVASWDENPYQKVFVGDGNVSLLTCLIEAWNRHSVAARSGYQHVERRFNVQDDYDDCCMICADGGDLICCEKCPSTYHIDCIGFKGVPKDAWQCPFCYCRHCDLDDANHPLLTCYQCSKKSHMQCSGFIREHLRWGLRPPNIPFCGSPCLMVYEKFEKKVGKRMLLGYSGFSWMIARRMDLDNGGLLYEDLHLKATCNTTIVLAAKLMNESFNRIVDRQTRSNMIETVVYNCGSNFTRTNFNRFYTVVLEFCGQIISVASLRMPSPDIAEIPFIATHVNWQRKGLCTLLLRLIESELVDISAKYIIIPSAEDMVESWVEKFGFTPLDEAVKKEISKLNILMFPKTTRLQKEIKLQNSAIKAQLDELNAQVEAHNAIVRQEEEAKVQQVKAARRTMVLDLNIPPEEQV